MLAACRPIFAHTNGAASLNLSNIIEISPQKTSSVSNTQINRLSLFGQQSVYCGNQAESLNILCRHDSTLFDVTTEGARSELGLNA
jgi:hypothetical protein